jgi:hypothetical protein
MDNQTIVRLLLIILAAIVLFAIVSYYNRNKSRLEAEKFSEIPSEKDVGLTKAAYAAAMPRANERPKKLYPGQPDMEPYVDPPRPVMENDPTPSYDKVPMTGGGSMSLGSGADNGAGGVIPMDPNGLEQHLAVDYGMNKMSSGVNDCYPSDSTQSVEQLLPKDAANSKWSQVNPAGQGDVSGQNYLTAGYHNGVDTVGQSLRNPSYDIRGETPNPRFNVSPWMQSTIEPDLNKRRLEGF